MEITVYHKDLFAAGVRRLAIALMLLQTSMIWLLEDAAWIARGGD